MEEERILEELRKALMNYDEEAVERLTKEIVEKDIDPSEAFRVLTRTLTEIGELFSEEKIYLPELAMAGEIALKAIRVLKPKIMKRRPELAKPLGRVVIGTVWGDLHDIGKTLVIMMLEISGFEVYDLGKDVPTSAFIEKTKEVDADIVAASAMISMTRLEQKILVEELRKSGLRDKVKVLVGGAVVDEAWRTEIGADAVGNDMMDAAVKAKRLMGVEQ